MGRFIMTSEVNTILGFTSTYDTSIQNWLPYMPGRVCAICNNFFKYKLAYVSGGDFVFSAAASTITTEEDDFVDDGRFKAGYDIYVQGTLYNDGFYCMSAVTSTQITIDTDSQYGIKVLVDENVETEDLYDVYISLIMWPKEIKPIVANMLRYDIFERDTKKGIQSEKIGNYSVSYFRAAGLGYNYPDDIIGGLDMFIIPAVG